MVALIITLLFYKVYEFWSGVYSDITSIGSDIASGFGDLAGLSYTRGTGTPASTCPDGTEKNGDLCYPLCKSGYTGVGPVCWQQCSNIDTGEYTTDEGALCLRPADSQANTYDRGVGTIPGKAPCASGLRDDGTSCWEDVKCSTVDDGYYNYTWGCVGCYDGNNTCRNDCYRTWIANLKTSCSGCGCIKTTLMQRQTCPSGQELVEGLCYPVCKSGYSSVDGAPTICKKACPSGYTDTGLTCYRGPKTIAKDTYGRGAGSPPGCSSGQDLDAGLCYPQCKSGYHGIAATCWKNT